MRLIDADALCDEVRKMADGYSCLVDCKIAGLLLKAPTIDPVKHGHWNNPVNDTLECSQCGAWCEKVLLGEYLMPKYCGNCGARMDEVSE